MVSNLQSKVGSKQGQPGVNLHHPTMVYPPIPAAAAGKSDARTANEEGAAYTIVGGTATRSGGARPLLSVAATLPAAIDAARAASAALPVIKVPGMLSSTTSFRYLIP